MSKANIVRTVVEIVVVGGLIGLVIDKEIRKKRFIAGNVWGKDV